MNAVNLQSGNIVIPLFRLRLGLAFFTFPPDLTQVETWSSSTFFLWFSDLLTVNGRMCDRITQVQDQINQIADHMCNAVGILQQIVAPSILPGHDKLYSTVIKNENSDFKPKDLPPLFATLLTRAVKELDVMIDRLPNDDQTLEPDVALIEQLNQINQDASRVFLSTTDASQRLLNKIQFSLEDIAECEMEIDRRSAGNPA